MPDTARDKTVCSRHRTRKAAGDEVSIKTVEIPIEECAEIFGTPLCKIFGATKYTATYSNDGLLLSINLTNPDWKFLDGAVCTLYAES
jgi:hypothetical protein